MEASERLKREDCIRTKHDSGFSKWQILVGPSDWEDYCHGKEGATRYRIDNLPTSSGPGLYELGIAVLPDPGLGRQVGRKLDSSRIVAVYLGQAGNVRVRLQGYGRSGNHLGKSYSGDHTHTNADKDVLPRKGSALFDEIFSRGHSLAFRWTSIESKSDAEKTEARLLDRFDYAWNKGRNGASRPNDVLQKLNKLDSTSVWFPNITRKMKIFSEKSAGVKIRASKPILLESESSSQKDESKKFLPRVFKFMNSQPRLIFVKSCHVDDAYIHSNTWNLEDENSTCGVELGNGKLCRNQPVASRKRCDEHKGLRVNSLVPKVATKGKPYVPECERLSGFSASKDKKYDNVSSQHIECRPPVYSDFSNICGATTLKGNPCTRPPVPGRVRCEDHKGRKKCESISNSKTKGNSTTNLKSSYLHDAYIHSTWSLEDENSTCGVELGNGKLCRNQPVVSRERCEEHKGLRVNSLVPKVATKGKPYVPEFERLSGFSASKGKKYDTVSSQHIECRPPVYSDFSNICGATTLKGNPCTRRPAIGNRQCWQHIECRPAIRNRPVYSDFSDICGATTLKGNPCTRRPAIGSRRCWQH